MTGPVLDTACRGCGEVFDAFTATDPDTPLPDNDSVSICLYCGDVALFVITPERFTLRAPTEDERERIMRDPEVVRILAARATLDLER